MTPLIFVVHTIVVSFVFNCWCDITGFQIIISFVLPFATFTCFLVDILVQHSNNNNTVINTMVQAPFEWFSTLHKSTKELMLPIHPHKSTMNKRINWHCKSIIIPLMLNVPKKKNLSENLTKKLTPQINNRIVTSNQGGGGLSSALPELLFF